MSSQRGNHKKGPQKHQNRTPFKNNLHDTSKRTKEINELVHHGLCERCKEIIEWKIKYKKYKPLTVPKKCTKCQQKAIKKAYYTICLACISKLNICGKCGDNKELTLQPGPSASEQMSIDSQMKQELQMLPERKRRTLFRLQTQGKLTSEEIEDKMKAELAKTGELDDDSFGEFSDNDSVDSCDSDNEEMDLIEKVSKVTFKPVEVGGI